MTVKLTKGEADLLRRLLREELHAELQHENNEELMKGVAWREEHEWLMRYKLRLLNKLGNGYSREEIKTYNL